MSLQDSFVRKSVGLPGHLLLPHVGSYRGKELLTGLTPPYPVVFEGILHAGWNKLMHIHSVLDEADMERIRTPCLEWNSCTSVSS